MRSHVFCVLPLTAPSSFSKKQSDPECLPGHFKQWGRHALRILGVYTNVFKTITTGMMVLKACPATPQEYTHAYRAVPNTFVDSLLFSSPSHAFIRVCRSPTAAMFYTKKFTYLCNVVPKPKALCGHLLYRSSDMFVFAKFVSPLPCLVPR